MLRATWEHILGVDANQKRQRLETYTVWCPIRTLACTFYGDNGGARITIARAAARIRHPILVGRGATRIEFALRQNYVSTYELI